MKNLNWLLVSFGTFLRFRSSVKKLPIAMFVHSYQSMFRDAFASTNIWLIMLHDHLHCLVFKEHLCFFSRAFQRALRESASIGYIEASALSRDFSNFFWKHSLLFCACNAVLSLSVADLHILREAVGFVNRQNANFAKKIGAAGMSCRANKNQVTASAAHRTILRKSCHIRHCP